MTTFKYRQWSFPRKVNQSPRLIPWAQRCSIRIRLSFHLSTNSVDIASYLAGIILQFEFRIDGPYYCFVEK